MRYEIRLSSESEERTMTKRIDQMRYESRQTAQLLRMEEELKKTLSREERREVDLRKRMNELNRWECKLEGKKVELKLSLKFVSTFVPSNLQPQVEGGSAEQKGGGAKQEDQRAANKGWEINLPVILLSILFFSLFLKKEERMLN